MAYLGNAPVVGDSTNSFRLLDDIASFTVTFDATDTSIVSISGDTLSFTNHRFVTGQKVTYTDGGGTAIGGLTDGTSYFIIKVDQNTIKLATNASNAASSTAIDLTSGAAGGSHTLKVAFDGVNTKFKATFNNGKKAKISRAGQISLSINGVIQQPQDSSSPSVGYGVEADSTIVFSTAPVATDKVFGTFIGEVAASFDIEDNTIDNFTGDGSTTIFNLSKEVPSSQDVLVTLDGVTQHPSDASTTRSYSVIDQALTFVSAPATGVAIQARHIGFAGATTSAVTGFYGRTGNAALINTDDISVQNISGVGATFTSNVNIEGVLTYEDVTNVDSIGIVTARAGVLVGSGITLSKDGDGFFTGIVTATSFSGSGTNLTGIDTDLVSDTSPQLGGNLDVNTKNILFGDSSDGSSDDVLIFGAGSDFKIYHDGHNIINGAAGQNLEIQTNAFRLRNQADSESMIVANANDNVELYYDNSKKFETANGGVSVTGGINLTTNLSLLDSGYLKLGTGDDLQLWHNATHSLIKNNTGRLYLLADDIWFKDKDDGDLHAKFVHDDAVELYYDNTKRIETSSTGATITGQLDVTGLIDTNSYINFGPNNNGRIYTDNNWGTIFQADKVSPAVAEFMFQNAGGTERLRVDNSGGLLPGTDNSQDLGSSSKRWRNLYTTDLQLSNEGKTNDVDGTWGNYTIQEGESDLFLINNRSGKKYKFNLTEVS